MSLSWMTDPAGLAALATLAVMEIVLGIDNLVFISILTNKLPEDRRGSARRLGIGLAVVLRLALLGTVALIVRLTEPVFSVMDHAFSWRDLILIGGGLFLIFKATTEIHHTVDPGDETAAKDQPSIGFAAAVAQILVLDLVFSLDSIITAVGMTDEIGIMAAAVVIAVGVMLLASGPLSRFIHANPTVVMLALGFLLVIGMSLLAEGFGAHVPKGYIYAAMAFSALIEALNMLARRARGGRSGRGPDAM